MDAITRLGNVWYAVMGFLPISTPRSKPVREFAGLRPAPSQGPVCLNVSEAGCEDVYCLTVPDTGNFELANGMIVSNCADSIRYGIMSRPWASATIIKLKPKRRGQWDDEEARESWKTA